MAGRDRAAMSRSGWGLEEKDTCQLTLPMALVQASRLSAPSVPKCWILPPVRMSSKEKGSLEGRQGQGAGCEACSREEQEVQCSAHRVAVTCPGHLDPWVGGSRPDTRHLGAGSS